MRYIIILVLFTPILLSPWRVEGYLDKLVEKTSCKFATVEDAENYVRYRKVANPGVVYYVVKCGVEK